MADPIVEEGASRVAGVNPSKIEILAGMCRKEKRKAAKKLKRKQIRKEMALRELAEEEARINDPEEQLRIRLKEQEEAERSERERKEFEEREKMWIEAAAARKVEEEAQQKILEESQMKQVEQENGLEEEDDWEYVDEGPAEIIWQGNEIIVKKKKVRVPKKCADQQVEKEDSERPTSNPLPPQSAAFAAYNSISSISTHQVFETVSQQTPNFGTEQDKAHCPFHIKTGTCRFGSRCSRVHLYPDKSCTLLIKNMYNGPGLAWEQDEGLEYTDEEVERCYEEFYEDVHTEFLKFGEIVNFKVCKNGSFHLRGNVYVHYKSLESAVLAYNSINGRYFAGKQITCEFVGVTRWKVAICGEYMKSRLKTCSHGTACNFIHCFRNPGGDYEWADWDNPPPKYWVKKMAALFGPSYELPNNDMELENQEVRNSSRKRKPDGGRYHNRRSRSGEDWHNSGSDGDDPDGKRARSKSYLSRQRSSKRGPTSSLSEHKQSSERCRTYNHDSDEGGCNDESRLRCHSHSRVRSRGSKKEQGFPDECNGSDDTHSSGDQQQLGNVHRVEYGSHLSRSSSSSQGKYMDFHHGYRKLELNYDYEDHERYYGKQRSRDYSSNVDHEENGLHDDRETGKGKRNHSVKVKLRCHDECKKSNEMYDFDDHDRYDGRSRSDYDSSVDYEESRRQSSNQSKRERTICSRMETNSPDEKRKSEENKKARER